ncbi:elongation factor G [Peptostreptococcus anaerobius]|uniref:Putative translation elongation factor G n=1 Tax=Peptostreptococcus anaerobius TaxID=1261 RepID=A0A135YYJ5_9FIRM|nr:elongation factor G [Peptostreptococcus anaerobius]KXI14478.1 putative translation elongation factor G [Peptostreptococcus anaerobius]MDU0964682.1 elongation factor G [Peptostreptococcus anaerobius]MDU0998406.1 elongation factor G [Peptostreptococcus anaerobius]MDU1174890.1 elongation factor G [Peptostreptococcus anaerobius]MDU1233491.1 elongation factor G [Peptostreptococcus anaerobius]
MKVYNSEKIRNIAVLGHSGCGKTNLLETIAHAANVNKIPKLSNNVQMTYSMSLMPVEYEGFKFNFLDTPGYTDFTGDVVSALAASDAAIIVIDATDPMQVGTEKALELTEGIPKIMFINKIDNEKARYKDVIAMLDEKFENKIVPMISPEFSDGKFVKLHNLFEDYEGLEGEFVDQAKKSYDALMELVAETDDDYLEKFFEGQELTRDEIRKGITIGVKRGDIVPVISGSTINNVGTAEILASLESYIDPSFVDEDAKFKGTVFKTFIDPFIGKISYIKVTAGQIKKDTEVYFEDGSKEKIANIYTIRGGELIELDKAYAGDIIVVTKVSKLSTGKLISTDKNAQSDIEIVFPKPQIYYAISPKNKNDEDKMATVITRLVGEDPTLEYYRNNETHQALIGGQGDLHLKTLVSKMKDKFGLEVELSDLKVPYRETIKASSDVEGKHKKQSGGHGQYGHVKIRFSRSDEEFEFTEELFGGSVPKSYVPAVEKGLRDSMLKGVLAGYPVTNIKAVLYDGSYHDVDSSEMAFKMAASIAFKKGMEEAKPILLEPVMKLTITIPEEYMGDVMGDMNKRRGKILGMESNGKGKQVLEALAPQGETFKYAIDLKSMTQGRGYFEMEFDSYAEVPSSAAEKIVAGARKYQ